MNENKNRSAIWITWENQVRNRTLSARLGATLYELESNSSRLIRYFILSWQTIRILLSTDANNIFVQNPSLVLALVANIIVRFQKKYLIIDAHNGGLFPLEGESKILSKIADWVVKISPLTIVTNQGLIEHVLLKGGKGVIVPDPLPDLPIISVEKKYDYSVLFICTWAKDEPYEEVIKAASLLPGNYCIYITGRYKKKLSEPQVNALPNNIVLTDFVTEEEYHRLLNQVDATLDLTTRNDCLVCGAYESVAVEKPMILSDTKSLREYFYSGALFTDNSADDIAQKIKKSAIDNVQLSAEIKILKKNMAIKWQHYLSDLTKQLI